VEHLVGLAEQLRVVDRGVPEQVDQVERRLGVDLRAVLDGVGHVEQLTDPRRQATGHVGLDPVADRHQVELAGPRGVAVVDDREAGGLGVALGLRQDLPQVVADVVDRVGLAAEEEERLRAGRGGLDPVLHAQAELVDQVEDLGVPGVDELPAVLGDLAAAPVPVRPAATTDPAGRLVHGRPVARLVQTVRGGQARQPRPDDHDPRPPSRGTSGSSAAGCHPGQPDTGTGRQGAAHESAPGEPASPWRSP
jgi:hypothetical protein